MMIDTITDLLSDDDSATDDNSEIDPTGETDTADDGVEATEGDGDRVRTPRFPARSTGFDRVESTDPPSLGEDTTPVLEALGYDEGEIDRFREAGVL